MGTDRGADRCAALKGSDDVVHSKPGGCGSIGDATSSPTPPATSTQYRGPVLYSRKRSQMPPAYHVRFKLKRQGCGIK
ncbi:hypothetical protein, unlikely [Trypanosoma brucei gambiense DAL972]|uniref:Uncharacterized protein n=1 Tax=Trypanosoma brucei gambiense (strain MHOM/CI/86/DAL972) TaxID=679716 RepID=C9ZIS8_TRYB9|nr:hypothetical protein, unlikely [Trypanosoma brucei gambiense DAL972]CBH09070.1 hypothetical protein, unlikely [Trypanosoma brucei gambiense DAL972]|eukprot:XP_011771511.1 hypothetical protein, unlikely [Trypanosoma brucei gambiense DAL972]